MKTPRELFPDQETACWGIDEPLSDLRFVKANAIQQAKGLIGWVYGTHAGHSLDGLRVLRADDGRYVAFRSAAPNLIPGQTARHDDLTPERVTRFDPLATERFGIDADIHPCVAQTVP